MPVVNLRMIILRRKRPQIWSQWTGLTDKTFFCGFNGCNLWDGFNQRTNTLNDNEVVDYSFFFVYTVSLNQSVFAFCFLCTYDVGI